MNRILTLSGAGFEAARSLAASTAPHTQGLHGHSFRLSVRHPHLALATLREAVHTAVAPFDYRYLNQALANPDNATLIAALADRLPEGCQLKLNAAPGEAILRTEQGEHLTVFSTAFEAAHQLPHVPAGHQCGRLHGHGFGVTLLARATTSVSALRTAWQPLFTLLNHSYLNQHAGLENPTSEVLAAWLWHRLRDTLPDLAGVTVRETASAGSHFNGQNFRIWKTQRFEAATPFDDQGRYTGHSYALSLHLAGDLDEVMGWVLDFGDVKARFKPFYAALDHHALDTVAGMGTPDCAGIATWALAQLAPSTPSLVRADVYQNDLDGALVWRGAA